MEAVSEGLSAWSGGAGSARRWIRVSKKGGEVDITAE